MSDSRALITDKSESSKRGPREHCRYFGIAGITIRVEADLPFTDRTFGPKLGAFEVAGPGEDTVTIRHHFSLPVLNPKLLGQQSYRKAPWAVYRNDEFTTYVGIFDNSETLWKVVVLSNDHSVGEFYHPDDKAFTKGGLLSLTMLPTDQIHLAALLADRQACYIHSGGAILNGQGLLFTGHSEAGKSTILKLLAERVEILCDDRNIVRRTEGEPTGFRVYGTWSHGELPDVSANSAPLKAIMFIEKSADNRLTRLTDRREILGRLLACLIRPLETRGWWEKTLGVIEAVCRDVPCYVMEFDKSGRIVAELEALELR